MTVLDFSKVAFEKSSMSSLKNGLILFSKSSSKNAAQGSMFYLHFHYNRQFRPNNRPQKVRKGGAKFATSFLGKPLFASNTICFETRIYRLFRHGMSSTDEDNRIRHMWLDPDFPGGSKTLQC